MNVEKVVAAAGAILISLLLVYKGELAPAIAISGSLLGFFVGESNGKRIASAAE